VGLSLEISELQSTISKAELIRAADPIDAISAFPRNATCGIALISSSRGIGVAMTSAIRGYTDLMGSWVKAGSNKSPANNRPNFAALRHERVVSLLSRPLPEVTNSSSLVIISLKSARSLHKQQPKQLARVHKMAPLLLTHFRARHRSVLTTLFAATFLGAVVVVAFPCPARPVDGARLEAGGDAPSSAVQKEVIVMMNQRGRRRFMEEE